MQKARRRAQVTSIVLVNIVVIIILIIINIVIIIIVIIIIVIISRIVIIPKKTRAQRGEIGYLALHLHLAVGSFILQATNRASFTLRVI